MQEKAKKYSRRVRQELPEVAKARDEKNRCNRNRDKLREYGRDSAKRGREALSDSYVTTVLATRLAQQGAQVSQVIIPPEVIRLKKGLILLKRLMLEKGLVESFPGMGKKGAE